MFAIAFDLDTLKTEEHHPKSVTQAYADIKKTLLGFNFEWKQGSVYTCDNEDLANLFAGPLRPESPPLVPRQPPRSPRLPRRAMVRLHPDDEVLTPPRGASQYATSPPAMKTRYT